MNTFHDYLEFGQIGEGQIAMWLRRRNWHVLPVYEKEIDTGKGPRLFMAQACEHSQLIAPDMLAMRGDKFIWVEAKRKTRFSWYGKGEYWVTGIDRRHYEDYCRVQEQTGLPVWIMFLHTEANTWPPDIEKWNAPSQCPVGLFGNSIDRLRNTVSHYSDRYGHTGMVYWRFEHLYRLAAPDTLNLQPN